MNSVSIKYQEISESAPVGSSSCSATCQSYYLQTDRQIYFLTDTGATP